MGETLQERFMKTQQPGVVPGMPDYIDWLEERLKQAEERVRELEDREIRGAAKFINQGLKIDRVQAEIDKFNGAEQQSAYDTVCRIHEALTALKG